VTGETEKPEARRQLHSAPSVVRCRASSELKMEIPINPEAIKCQIENMIKTHAGQ
jgi:hypothetical protein